MILKELENPNLQEAAEPDKENVYDPVIIIGKDNSVFWFGGDQKMIQILNEIYKNESNVKKISDLEYFNKLSEDERNFIYMNFRNDTSLVCISENEEIVFNFTNINSTFQDEIKFYLSDFGNTNSLKNTVTPTLKAVSEWKYFDTVLKPETIIGYALAIYFKIVEANIKMDKQKLHIIIDHQ